MIVLLLFCSTVSDCRRTSCPTCQLHSRPRTRCRRTPSAWSSTRSTIELPSGHALGIWFWHSHFVTPSKNCWPPYHLQGCHYKYKFTQKMKCIWFSVNLYQFCFKEIIMLFDFWLCVVCTSRASFVFNCFLIMSNQLSISYSFFDVSRLSLK